MLNNKECRDESLRRLSILANRFNIIEHLYEAFEKSGTVYFSNEDNFISTPVAYKKSYADAINQMEEKFGIVVYYAIEKGASLFLLFVCAEDEPWTQDEYLDETVALHLNFETMDVSMDNVEIYNVEQILRISDFHIVGFLTNGK